MQLLFIISVAPVAVIGWFIWSRDKEKESSKLLVRLFCGGLFSCVLVVLVSWILDFLFPAISNLNSSQGFIPLLFNVFVGIALVEEFCKWLMVYTLSFKHKEFDYFYDGIVYSVFVALGFACIENLIYVLSSGIGTGILRAVLAVPGHACDGIFMGYYLGLAKIADLHGRKKEKSLNLFLSILVPTLLHGIYDYCLMTENAFFIIAFFAFVIVMYVISFKRVKRVSDIKRKIIYRNTYCPNCGRAVESDYCPNCGYKHE